MHLNHITNICNAIQDKNPGKDGPYYCMLSLIRMQEKDKIQYNRDIQMNYFQQVLDCSQINEFLAQVHELIKVKQDKMIYDLISRIIQVNRINLNMYKKPTSIPNRKPTLKQEPLRRDNKNVIDKKSQTNSSEFKSHEERIIFLIKEYLMQNGYNRSYQSLKRQKPIRKVVVHNQMINKVNDGSREIISAFQKGQRQQFFKHTSKWFAKNDETMKKFQFQLQIYFCIYAVHPSIKKSSTIDKNHMEVFKKFLDQKGSQLSNSDEFLQYFALPYLPKPQQNPALAQVFKKQWIAKLKQKVLQQIKQKNQGSHQVKTARKLSQLEQMYNKYVQEQNQTSKENFNHADLESTIEQLKLHNKELLAYISRLQTSFAQLGESSRLNIIQSNRKWFNFSKELLHQIKKASRGQKVDSLQKYEGFFGKSLQQLINGADISLFDRGSFVGDDRSFIPEIKNNQSNLPKKQDSCGYQIDMTKIQTLFANADNPDKQVQVCLVLKALKNRFAKLKSQYLKRQVIVEYSRHDVCGVTPQKYYIQKKLLVQGSSQIRQFYLRLANAISLDIYGIQYLSKSDCLIQNLIKLLNRNEQTAESKKFMLGIVQKFSYVKRSRSKMIQLGIIPLMLKLFNSSNQDIQLESFTSQYLTATIMNLAMNEKSKSDFVKYKKEFIQIMMDLIDCQNQQTRNYVNGSIFLLLQFNQLKQEANKHHMAVKIKELLKPYQNNEIEEDNFYTQFMYILERLQKKQDEQEMDKEDSGDEEDQVIQMDQFQEEEQLDQTEDQDQSSQYIEGEEDFMSGQQYLMKEFALLGPEAVKQQLLNRSVLDQTSKKINNMTMSINHSRRMDNIFSQRPGTPTLQPELDKLLHGDEKKDPKETKLLKKI